MTGDLVELARRQWRLVLGVPALVGAFVVGVGLLLPRTYEVPLVVAPVSNKPNLGGAGLAASVLGASLIGGFQSSPALVSRLARLDGVLLGVAKLPSGDGDRRVIDRIEDEPAGEVNDRDALDRMREVISASADLQTGLVTIRVSAKDSAMVRLVSDRILAATSAAFVEAARAQASAIKTAQDARVAAAAERLTAAEEALRRFKAGNRQASDFAASTVTEARLTRELDVAEDVYRRAAEDREGAASRELEETPALVVVDGVPASLQPRSRGLLLKAILWSGLAFVLTLLAVQALAFRSREPRAA